jgi:hypothetical protein
MKKLLIATFLIGMMGGCTEPTVASKSTNYTVPKIGGEASSPMKICVIEACEYFICDVYAGAVIVHKGNCSNPIHKGGNK